MTNLRGHTALITGGTQGVGAAIALSLAKSGADLILHGLKNDDLAKKTIADCREHGVTAELLVCDLNQSIPILIEQIATRSLEIAPHLDLLVNNAGVFIDKPFTEMNEATFDCTFHINVKVGYFLSQHFANRWIESGVAGRILFTGSINGLLSEPDHTAYDASKAAVAGMVRSLCVALAPQDIRVNAIAPGLVRTPLTNQVLERNPRALKWMELHTPNQKVPAATACGPMAAFLLSDDAEHIHGQTVYIDGGMSVWQQPDLPVSFQGEST